VTAWEAGGCKGKKPGKPDSMKPVPMGRMRYTERKGTRRDDGYADGMKADLGTGTGNRVGTGNKELS